MRDHTTSGGAPMSVCTLTVSTGPGA
jgi:hypothetical protein